MYNYKKYDNFDDIPLDELLLKYRNAKTQAERDAINESVAEHNLSFAHMCPDRQIH